MTLDAPVDSALLHVYFKELGVVEYVRNELYTEIDFVG